MVGRCRRLRLLVVNLGVLLIVLMRDDESADTLPAASVPADQAATRPPQVPAPQPGAAPPATRPATNPTVRSLAEEAGATSDPYYDSNAPADASDYTDPEHPEVAAAANVPAGPPVVRPIAPPSVAPPALATCRRIAIRGRRFW